MKTLNKISNNNQIAIIKRLQNKNAEKKIEKVILAKF